MEEQLPNLQISFWNRHLVKFIFVGIFIIASLIRFVGLADGKSFDISRAEIKEVVQVQQINGAVVYQNWPMLRLEGARFVLPKGFVHKNSDPFFESILPSFLVYPIYFLLNFDLEKIIFAYSIIGGLTAAMVFLASQLFLNRFKSLFVGIFYSFGFWPIFESHLLLNLSFSPILSILVFYFSVKIIRYGASLKNWIFLTLFLSLSIQFQATNILFVLATLTAFLLLRKPDTFLSWKKNLFVLFIFVLVTLPFIMAEVLGGFEQTQAWFSYLPRMFLTNIVDIYKDVFIAIGQAVSVFVLPTVIVETFYKWLIGLIFVLVLFLRLKFLKRTGQKQALEFYLLILLGVCSLMIYFNYLAYFKGQSHDFTVVKNLGFFWPILTIFLTYSVTKSYKEKYFPITVIVGFIILMNLFVWAKNLDLTKLTNTSYGLKSQIVEMVLINSDTQKSEILLELENFDQSVFVFLMSQLNYFVLDSINGSKISTIDIKRSGDDVLYVLSIGRDVVFVGVRPIAPKAYSLEKKFFVISDKNNDNQFGKEVDKVNDIQLYQAK
ncbi:hypothetical protein KBB41_03515 [Candidatus Curtissbacteria bacterium]|nr:hypothetical protein [Candidatus Curtissbacteria bacterium]